MPSSGNLIQPFQHDGHRIGIHAAVVFQFLHARITVIQFTRFIKTAPFKDGIHALRERLRPIRRHERLDGPAESTAVHARDIEVVASDTLPFGAGAQAVKPSSVTVEGGKAVISLPAGSAAMFYKVRYAAPSPAP